MIQQTIRYAGALPALLVVLLLFGCGMDNPYLPAGTEEVDTTPLGAYSSADRVMELIRDYGETSLQEYRTNATSSGIRMAPAKGYKNLGVVTEQIQPAVGGELVLSVKQIDKAVRFQVLPGALAQNTKIQMKAFITRELYLLIPKSDKKATDAHQQLIEQAMSGLSTLYFEFTPSGTQFAPSAQLIVPFELILTEDIGNLSIIVTEDDNKFEAEDVCYDIDWKNEWLIAYVPHFSQYYFKRN